MIRLGQPMLAVRKWNSGQVAIRVFLAILGLMVIAVSLGLGQHFVDDWTSIYNGFTDGLLYPLSHLEHLVFWVALGCLAATRPQGVALPITWALVAIAGTYLPMLNLALPGLHLVVTLSIVGLGVALLGRISLQDRWLTSIGAVLALFHGNAQASALLGQSSIAIAAYLGGLLIIQLALGLTMYQLSLLLLWHKAEHSTTWFRWLGLLIIGIGLTTVGYSLHPIY